MFYELCGTNNPDDATRLETYELNEGWTYRIRYISADYKTQFTRDMGNDMFKPETYTTEKEAMEACIEAYTSMRHTDWTTPNLYRPNREVS